MIVQRSKHVEVFSVLMSYNCVNTKTVYLLVNYYKSVITNAQKEQHKKRQATYVYRNIEARPRNHCCRGKTISIAYSECVFVSLGPQHAKRLRRIIFSSAARPALPYFPTLSHNRHDFRENLLSIKYVF
jgi:hypothetical protein